MNHFEKKILVDLTPVLKGGTNGGAKVFVIELLKKLIEMKPNYCWILAIRSSVKQELSSLKANNVIFIIEHRIVKDDFLMFLHSKGYKYLKNNPLVPFFVIPFLKKIFNIFWEKRKFKKMLMESYDLLFCPFTAPVYFKKNIPTVSVIYDLQYKTFPYFFSPEDVNHRHTTFVDTCNKSTKLIAISDYSRDKVIEHSDFPSEDIKTIYLSLANRLTLNKSSKVLSKYGFEEKKYFIYPANFWKHKNHEMLIASFDIARKKGLAPNIKLALTGAPCDRQEFLKQLVHKKGLSKNIVFLDYVSSTDLSTLMANSLALVFPSLYEGFGIPVVEAMSLNIPVLCSNLTSLPEVAADAALTFDPRDPMQIAENLLTTASNDSLRKELIEKGKKRVVNFLDINQMATDYLDVFEQALEKSQMEDYHYGLYEDNWIGENLIFQVGKNAQNEYVEFEFLLPDFVNQKVQLTVERVCFLTKKIKIEEYSLIPGERKLLRYDISAMGGRFSIKSNFYFKPLDFLEKVIDTRTLTLMLTKYDIARGEPQIAANMGNITDAIAVD